MEHNLAPITAGQMAHHLLFSCTCGSFYDGGLELILDIGHLNIFVR